MCKILPVSADLTEFCLKRGIFHPNINFIPNAEVIEFSGNPGDFTAKLNIKNQFVIKENCISCGECIKVCPISVRDEFQGRLQMRKAIYVRCPTSVPQIYTIDINACTKCGECVKVCPTKAIELSRREINKTINIGTVILAPGFEEFNPESLSEFGYGRFSNVMTSTQFERALSDAGPYAGKFVRPSDNTVSKKVAFLQCIGSRDQQRDYCSSACCMYAIKEANLLKEIYPDTEITIFFMDLRTFGKDYYKYALEAKKRGIIFVRCRVPAIEENIKTKDLKLKYETEDGKMVREDFNLVVLSVGQCPPGDVKDLAKVFGIELNRFNFAKTNPLIQVETNRPGVYVCGSFREPVAIQEAVIQASAAANKSLNHLSEEVVVSKLDAQREKMAEHIGIFICECGKDISNAIDIEKLIEFNKSFPDVMVSEKISYLCLEQGLEQIRKAISEHQLTSLVFGACAPYKYEPLFVRLGREYAIPAEKIEIIDLREGLAWTSRDKTLNTKKAQSLIAVAYERQRLQEELCISDYQFTKRVLVIGGGPAGIVTALNLTRSGIEVDLIEKTDKLGGNLRNMYNTLTSIQPQKFLDEILQKLGENKKIKVFTNAEIKKVGGQVGSFVAEYVYENNSITSQYGAIVIATGGNEYQPKEYLYGKDQRIITQRELSKKLLDCKTMGLSDNQTIVMIQCVGSLNDEHPYCSRVCCTRAITNALRLKEINPEVNIYILYREMMAYGFREEYFTKAREAGILFLRYEPNKLPQVTVNNNKLELRVDDQILNEKLCINPDLLVLSTGISPNDNRPLAQMLGLPVSKEGFFEEFNIKYRPLEFTISGIFVCGLAHSPMSLEEAITQANAVCTKVKRLLARSSYLSGKYRAEVKDRWCAGCGLCVESCPVHAR
ncbi:MAG: FAD-dependent oxidoreductase, partial [candidate division WOR-3 bacterium]